MTLLEPLANALGLGVEDLMACRRPAAELPQKEESMKNLLTISSDAIQREKKRSWKRLTGVVCLFLAAALAAAYSLLTVTEQRKSTVFLKETIEDTDYVYVKERGHLLKLRCGPDVDFDAIDLENEWGEALCYQLNCRWNRCTYQGTVTACKATGELSLGSDQGMIGAAVGLDYNTETQDSLFGYSEVFCRYDNIYPNPDGKGSLYTCSFVLWNDAANDFFPKPLLTAEETWATAQADWDSDGVTELLVRTRWPEKPYTVYDLVDGKIVETWPDSPRN